MWTSYLEARFHGEFGRTCGTRCLPLPTHSMNANTHIISGKRINPKSRPNECSEEDRWMGGPHNGERGGRFGNILPPKSIAKKKTSK